jgi:hypothetical protein
LRRKVKVPLTKENREWLPMILFCFAFLFTLLNTLTYTTLVGEDVADHITGSLQILEQAPLRGDYPVLFRALLAPLLSLTGTQELPDILLLVKILASAIAAFGVLMIYVYVKRAFGFSPAILSSFLIAISQKNMQMVGWGGLPNLTSLVLFPLAFYFIYLMSEGTSSSNKKNLRILFFLILLSSFLFHYWSGAILFSIVALYYLLSAKRRNKILVLVGSMVAGLILLNFGAIGSTVGAALSRTIIFCTQREALIHLGLLWDGILSTLSVGAINTSLMPILIGVGLILVIYRLFGNNEKRASSLALISWLIVPFLLLFSITYWYYWDRFLYFLTYPAFILTSIAAISILQYALRTIKILTLFLEGSKKIIVSRLLPLALVSLFTLSLLSQGYGSMRIIGENLQLFYPESSNAIISSINWGREFTPQDSTIVSTSWGGPPWVKGPSHWMMLTGRNTLTNLSVLSDLVINVDTKTLRIYEGVYNNYENPRVDFRVINPFENDSHPMISFMDARSMLTYNDLIRTPLSDFQERSIQTLNESSSEVLVLSHSTYKQFTLTKSLILRNDTSSIELIYNITANQRLEEAYLTLDAFLPNVTFSKVLLPGVLEWGSPWDNPTDMSVENHWASITSTSDNMTESLVAYTNSMDNILAVLRFDEKFSITINSTKERGIHESVVTFPLGTIQENETRSIRMELGFFNLRSTWNQITTGEIKQLFGTLNEGGAIKVRSLQGTIDLLSSRGPIYVMSEDEYLSLGFPDCTLFNRIYDNDYIVAYLNRK